MSIHPSNSSNPSNSEQNQEPNPAHKAKGWTLGNSNNLVEGAQREPVLVSIAWLVLPLLFGLGLLLLFF